MLPEEIETIQKTKQILHSRKAKKPMFRLYYTYYDHT